MNRTAELTNYVGRQPELNRLATLLGSEPLVTLTGPGGVGKTRLARRVADAERTRYPDGVVFVSLAELREPELLVDVIADRLGLGNRSTSAPIEVLVDQLSEMQLLLLLDNCEHLLAECRAAVHALLVSCPGVTVLATSRQSLGVPGERVFPIAPLEVPDQDSTPEQVAACESVRLFVDRATAVVPSFVVSKENAADLAGLCRRLDGLPLAIELVAVRLRSLSVHQLAGRLASRFALLEQGSGQRSDRHGTVHALVDWSYELCTPAERLLWARASVFAGGFDLDAAEQVCVDERLRQHEVLDVLDALIDKSILLREEHGTKVRYRMLEIMRQYGAQSLRHDDDLVRMRRCHRDWCLRLAEDFSARWFGGDQGYWIVQLRLEQANLREAMDFCTSEAGEAETGLRLACAMRGFWIARGLSNEGRIWLHRLTSAAGDGAAYRATAFWVAAFLALLQGDREASQAALASATAVAEAESDEHALGYVQHVRGYTALMDSRSRRAVELFAASAAVFRAKGDVVGELWSTYNHGLALALVGNLDQGRKILQECVDRYAARGEIFWRCWALWSRSAAEYLRGDLATAEEFGREAMRRQDTQQHRILLPFSLTVMAGCASQGHNFARAARLFGAAATAWRALGVSPTNFPAFTGPRNREIELVTGNYGIENAAREYLIGAGYSAAQAYAYALEPPTPETPETPEPRRAETETTDVVLTRREREIAELVAAGLRNKEIAGRLRIAQRTAETHVDHILTKLGFANRAQIAAWYVESRGN